MHRHFSESVRRDTSVGALQLLAENRHTAAQNGTEQGAADLPRISRAIMTFAKQMHSSSTALLSPWLVWGGHRQLACRDQELTDCAWDRVDGRCRGCGSLAMMRTGPPFAPPRCARRAHAVHRGTCGSAGAAVYPWRVILALHHSSYLSSLQPQHQLSRDL